MVDTEYGYGWLSSHSVEVQPTNGRRCQAITFMTGLGLLLMAFVAATALTPTLHSTRAIGTTSLVTLPQLPSELTVPAQPSQLAVVSVKSPSLTLPNEVDGSSRSVTFPLSSIVAAPPSVFEQTAQGSLTTDSTGTEALSASGPFWESARFKRWLPGQIAILLGVWGYLQLGTAKVPADMLGGDDIMSKKAHGTCPNVVPSNLRWGCDPERASTICCYNRVFAEPGGYFEYTDFLSDPLKNGTDVTFYDTVTGKPLFVAPRGRTWDEFVAESRKHGWPSFRDAEVLRENVRVLPGGEAVSIDGTHLGHNILDLKGNRYCINLVSIAGMPPGTKS